MLLRGIACTLIGVIVLIAPHLLQSPAYREMVGGASVVGWFAIVLGVALVAVELVQCAKRQAGKAGS